MNNPFLCITCTNADPTPAPPSLPGSWNAPNYPKNQIHMTNYDRASVFKAAKEFTKHPNLCQWIIPLMSFRQSKCLTGVFLTVRVDMILTGDTGRKTIFLKCPNIDQRYGIYFAFSTNLLWSDVKQRNSLNKLSYPFPDCTMLNAWNFWSNTLRTYNYNMIIA